jgi:hypothetical protein
MTAKDAGTSAPSAEPALEEIWRPGKRKEARKPQTHKRGSHEAKAKRPRQRDRQPQAERQREQTPPRLERKERRRVSDTSPFAVLAELRRSLAARRPEGN